MAMSALYTGYPLKRNDDYDARAYLDFVSDWFEKKELTGCLVITRPSDSATCLGFIYKGKFCGALYIEGQKFSAEITFIHQLLSAEPQANLEAHVLPSEMTSSAVRPGISLSLANAQRKTNAQRKKNRSEERKSTPLLACRITKKATQIALRWLIYYCLTVSCDETQYLCSLQSVRHVHRALCYGFWSARPVVSALPLGSKLPTFKWLLTGYASSLANRESNKSPPQSF